MEGVGTYCIRLKGKGAVLCLPEGNCEILGSSERRKCKLHLLRAINEPLR